MRLTAKLRKAFAAGMSGLLALGLAFSIGKAPVKADDELNMPLSLNIYAFGGSGAEKGQPVTVTGEGQYEVSFDIASDLSEAGKEAGLTAIKDFGAIYISDDSALTTGESPVSSCKIKYDAVIVDGTELTVTQTEPKEAVKSNGIFDTNDPINAWDGSAVEEITTDPTAFTVNFTTVENPQKITIKFTLSDIVMAEGGKDEETTPAEPDETTAAAGETTAASSEVAEFDPSSDEYVAQMYIQVGGSWVFRNTYSDKDFGTVTDYKYKGQLSDVQDSENPVPHDGTFTDVVLKGNGTYTVTLENPDFTNGGGTAGELFNLIGVSTSIPASAEETVKITDMTIQVNDSAMLKYTYPEVTFDPDGIKAGYLNALGVNIWNSEVCTDANAVFGDKSNWPGEVTKVTVTFTVSGFDHDAPAGGEEETTAAGNENETKDGATKADNNNDKKDDSKGGLPTGAIIGIIAGVVVLVIIVVIVVVSKKKKK